MFTTLKSQSYYNTYSNVHHHTIACFQSLCLWMLSLHVSQFVSDTDGGFIYGWTNWCLPSGLPPWYTLAFRQLHIKTSNGFKLGGWMTKQPKQLVHIFQTVFLQNLYSKFLLPLNWYAQVPSHVLATSVTLQEEHPLNTKEIHFTENSLIWSC